ncbi:uncharacterized protein CPUR_07343 [Claviceps purpurea 20.1]|uniref:Uncharacterized protein n=1 Tax=Claviceps purpurea (strain 20.1) TaxID=1111077 RepID=M1WHW1_CLAP2|nr:hypothetical protein E4U51_005640 [Claviceps purpurea]KAG6178088.1 hypothetical protein E4U27_003957 [Claviceps purpurea]KAG6180274.1 hypothetical protein E4U10_007588 [Claviceps purpurea]KAG6268176.1 hypothetical protein E4U48_004795 [Claviceps purpurea]CCE33419.1 uncharacterized protein CPUR_07343 [Claviceps purpurea 20.1]
MATKRLLSAPPAPSCPASTSPSSDSTLVGASPPVPRSRTSPINPELFDRAEKLARMTNELRLHKLISQINNLISDVTQLKVKTKDNEAFCRQHGGRLDKVCLATEAARALAESCMQLRDGDKLEVKDYVRDVVQVKVDMCNMKSVVEELVEKMGMLPTLAEANAVLAAVRTQREACESASASIKGCARTNSVRSRIEETIRSTRRWHMDHKTTKLSDADFIAKYLKKQSRRDPGMTVYLQKAIWKRVEAKARDSPDVPPRRPQSLAEFCKYVTWEDVKRAVEDVLVRRVHGEGAESLSQMQMDSR